MAERQIVTLPYGEGLDRATGRMVVQPSKFEDLRNVFMFDGKAQSRNGLIQESVLLDDVAGARDTAVLLQALRSTSTAMGIGYESATREIWVNTLTRDGEVPINVGLLGVLSASASFIPPIIIGADSDNKMFLAHNEPTLVDRIVTQFYDPLTSPNLNNLQADLDGEGAADVFFLGVVRHLSYIFGWGYGNATDPNRGDVVRVSLSGDSSMFRDTDFFEAGQQGEPVMVCRPASTFLMVFKETETYQIFGYSPDTFGIRPSDTLFGCIGSPLAVSIAACKGLVDNVLWHQRGNRADN